MKESEWPRRIDRARVLGGEDPAVATLLTQYATILEAQRACYDTLSARPDRLTGSLERDLAVVRPCATRAFSTLRPFLPPEIIGSAPVTDAALDELLYDGWRAPSAPFLARLILQPYAEALVRHRHRPEGRDLTPRTAACPFCAAPPQASVHHSDASADGGGRTLICALCSTEWPFPRIRCVNCGEQDEHRLIYFRTDPADRADRGNAGFRIEDSGSRIQDQGLGIRDSFSHVRVDACETCGRYLKTVDLTRFGLAVPIVDEVASAVLDIWAQDRGYTKVELNLLGL